MTTTELMTVREIVKNYLAEQHYDGLYNPGNCSCKTDELMICMNYIGNCKPGILVDCKTCEAIESCNHDFCISRKEKQQ